MLLNEIATDGIFVELKVPLFNMIQFFSINIYIFVWGGWNENEGGGVIGARSVDVCSGYPWTDIMSTILSAIGIECGNLFNQSYKIISACQGICVRFINNFANKK